jgi:hypothetical protein
MDIEPTGKRRLLLMTIVTIIVFAAGVTYVACPR